MQPINYDIQDELGEEFLIDFKKLFFTLWNRKYLILKVFLVTLIFFILLTYILPKKYIVDADLYINKAQESNLAEINPYVIEELSGKMSGGLSSIVGSGSMLTNELELIQSPLVIDKVVKENNIIYKKKFGILPNKKEGEFVSTKDFLKKNISIENKKGTNVITIEYKNKKPDIAYGVVNSLINNYILLNKEKNKFKSQSDIHVLEEEYKLSKAELNNLVAETKGMPQQATTSLGNIYAMSAFSKSAQESMQAIRGNLIQGAHSQIEIEEAKAKVAELSQKLAWAKMVEQMSDTSKVLVIKEPKLPRDFEYVSPKLLINILLGIIFGSIFSVIACIFKEFTDDTLTFHNIGEDIIYNILKEKQSLKTLLISKRKEKTLFILHENLPNEIIQNLKEFKNIDFVPAEISEFLGQKIEDADNIILVSSINKTSSALYKEIKSLISKLNKSVIKDILV